MAAWVCGALVIGRPLRKLIDRKHLERRVLGRDNADLVVAQVRPGALEDTDLGLPVFEVRAQSYGIHA